MAAPDRRRLGLPPKMIVRIVADYRGITPAALAGPYRNRHLAWPRQEAAWLLYRHTSMSLPMIGRILGGRDHTTIMHAINAVERRRRDNPDYRFQIEELLALIDRANREIAARSADETVCVVAERLIRDPGAADRAAVLRLASAVLAVAAVQADPALHDADARTAGRQLLSSPIGATLPETL